MYAHRSLHAVSSTRHAYGIFIPSSSLTSWLTGKEKPRPNTGRRYISTSTSNMSTESRFHSSSFPYIRYLVLDFVGSFTRKGMIPTSVVLSLLSLTITVAVAPLPASALSIPCLFTGTKEDVACSVLSRPNSGVTVPFESVRHPLVTVTEKFRFRHASTRRSRVTNRKFCLFYSFLSGFRGGTWRRRRPVTEIFSPGGPL